MKAAYYWRLGAVYKSGRSRSQSGKAESRAKAVKAADAVFASWAHPHLCVEQHLTVATYYEVGEQK